MTKHDMAQLHADRVAAVQGSFSLVHAEAQANGQGFYKRLCEASPELMEIFGTPPDTSAPRMMDMVNTIVVGMAHLEAVLPVVRDLADDYAQVGMRPEHYEVMGCVLMDCLEDALGPSHFNPFVRESWEAGYAALSQVMIRSSQNRPAKIARHLAEPPVAGLVPARASSY
jgi:nitric oxide dioxygenase